MPGFAGVAGIAGSAQLTPYNLPDTTSRMAAGLVYDAVDNFWGGGEFMYVKANGSIRQFGLVVITQTIASNAVVYNATEVPNTANLGRMLGVAMVPASSGQFLWVCIGGVVPVNCNAAVSADTAFGIVAAGQGGAIANGKQVLNGRIVIASTTTVAKAGCVANNGSLILRVPNSSGWFAGAPISGTGIQAGTYISDIDPSGTVVTLTQTTSAAVNGTVTVTYNDGTIYYNVAHLNRPFAQGQVT